MVEPMEKLSKTNKVISLSLSLNLIYLILFTFPLLRSIPLRKLYSSSTQMHNLAVVKKDVLAWSSWYSFHSTRWLLSYSSKQTSFLSVSKHTSSLCLSSILSTPYWIHPCQRILWNENASAKLISKIQYFPSEMALKSAIYGTMDQVVDLSVSSNKTMICSYVNMTGNVESSRYLGKLKKIDDDSIHHCYHHFQSSRIPHTRWFHWSVISLTIQHSSLLHLN